MQAWDTKLLRDRELQEIASGGFGRCSFIKFGEAIVKDVVVESQEVDMTTPDSADEDPSEIDDDISDTGNTSIVHFLDEIDDCIITFMNTKARMGKAITEALELYPGNVDFMNRQAIYYNFFPVERSNTDNTHQCQRNTDDLSNMHNTQTHDTPKPNVDTYVTSSPTNVEFTTPTDLHGPIT